MYTHAGHKSNPFHAGQKSHSIQHVNLFNLEVPDLGPCWVQLTSKSLMYTDSGHRPSSFQPMKLLKLEVVYWALAGLLSSSRGTANPYRSSKHS